MIKGSAFLKNNNLKQKKSGLTTFVVSSSSDLPQFVHWPPIHPSIHPSNLSGGQNTSGHDLPVEIFQPVDFWSIFSTVVTRSSDVTVLRGHENK